MLKKQGMLIYLHNMFFFFFFNFIHSKGLCTYITENYTTTQKYITTKKKKKKYISTSHKCVHMFVPESLFQLKSNYYFD